MTRTIIIPIINILSMESLLFFILHNFVIDENNRNKKDERRALHGAEKNILYINRKWSNFTSEDGGYV
ncbi:hypothetical protein bcgnr5390_29210 [Bacillus luti]